MGAVYTGTEPSTAAAVKGLRVRVGWRMVCGRYKTVFINDSVLLRLPERGVCAG